MERLFRVDVPTYEVDESKVLVEVPASRDPGKSRIVFDVGIAHRVWAGRNRVLKSTKDSSK